MRSKSLVIDRINLVNGVLTPIHPDRVSSHVTILNGTNGDLEVHDRDADDGQHFLVITAGLERALPKLHNNNTQYDDAITSFWLRGVDGLVILIWT